MHHICLPAPRNETRAQRLTRLAGEPKPPKTPQQPTGVSLCHYCLLQPARTKDHVVPQNRLAKGQRRLHNTVRCCQDCNSSKSSFRIADHDCGFCKNAWETYGPEDWENTVPTITMEVVISRARKRQNATR